MPTNIRSIVIVGDGIAAWLTASALARTLRNNVYKIHIMRSASRADNQDDSLGCVSAAEATLPSTAEYLHDLGYDENALLNTTKGCFTLGTAISDWAASENTPRGTVFNAFGEVGASMASVAFPQLVMRLHEAGHQAKFANYSLAALCAQSGRFARPTDDQRSVLSVLAYGLHVDVAAYTQAMKADALANGAQLVDAKFNHAVVGQEGLITAVIGADTQRVDGDLFIDCTGPARQLATHARDVKFSSWQHWLPCDKVSSVLHRSSDAPQPFTHLTAQPAGWQRLISLPGKQSETTCFQSLFTTTDVASTAQDYLAGCCEQPWYKNCVVLGGAAAVVDPTASLAIHLLQSAIQRLLTLLPNERHCDTEATEYNRQAALELECARDYAMLPYKLNGRNGEPFWDHCRHMSVPDTLTHRIALYESCGRIALHDGEVADAMNWLALFDAQGIHPKQYDAVARGIAITAILEHCTRVRAVMLRAVAALPTHAAYLNRLKATAGATIAATLAKR